MLWATLLLFPLAVVLVWCFGCIRGWKPVPKARSCREYLMLPTAWCQLPSFLGDMGRACEPGVLSQQSPACPLVSSVPGPLGHAHYMLCPPYITKIQLLFIWWLRGACHLPWEAVASPSVLHHSPTAALWLRLGDQTRTVPLVPLTQWTIICFAWREGFLLGDRTFFHFSRMMDLRLATCQQKLQGPSLGCCQDCCCCLCSPTPCEVGCHGDLYR